VARRLLFRTPFNARPGLESASKFMPKTIAGDIASLVEACQTAHARGIFVEKNDAASKAAARGRVVAAELAAALEYVLDDGKITQSDDALAVVKNRESANGTVAQLAQSLVDLATLAEREVKALGKLGGFGDGLIAEATKLGTDLLAAPNGPGRTASEALQLRDKLLTLLGQKVGEVRRTACYVFRNHPEVQKLATSRYQRQRRAEQRKQTSDTGVTAAQGAPSAPSA